MANLFTELSNSTIVVARSATKLIAVTSKGLTDNVDNVFAMSTIATSAGRDYAEVLKIDSANYLAESQAVGEAEAKAVTKLCKSDDFQTAIQSAKEAQLLAKYAPAEEIL